MSSVLAIDAGQTGTKLRHLDGEAAREWEAPGIRTDLPLVPQLTRVLGDAANRGGRVEFVGIGVSGLTDDAADARSLLGTAALLGARSLTLAHDSITAYLGALGDSRGAVVASGTGVVTLAVGERAVARVDGWGNIMGDAGSGYWIGRAALDAVMRSHDGRGPATALTEFVVADFPRLEDAYMELQGDDERVPRVARYARTVAELASSDGVAARIIASAAEELAHSVVTGLGRVGEDSVETPQVRAIGGVYRSRRLADAFEDVLRVRLPRARVLIGTADPLDGAARLPGVGEHSALRARLVRAGAAAS
ncbi:N-acetylglucosamine kinase [Agromyces sp. Marseille-Q5079]|uniref:N-acetylglucosamine kinase n=1 Tax=Agromyces sp. Marseille-Q5079 TaxID=3439059 RepID=UPI003D9C8BF6